MKDLILQMVLALDQTLVHLAITDELFPDTTGGQAPLSVEELGHPELGTTYYVPLATTLSPYWHFLDGSLNWFGTLHIDWRLE